MVNNVAYNGCLGNLVEKIERKYKKHNRENKNLFRMIIPCKEWYLHVKKNVKNQ